MSSQFRSVSVKSKTRLLKLSTSHKVTKKPVKKVLIKPKRKITTIAGAQTTVSAFTKPIVAPQKQDSYALVIGVNYVQEPSARLRGCANDAINVCDYLVKTCNMIPGKIRILSDEIDASKLNEINSDLSVFGEPSKANIMAGIEWLVACSKMNGGEGRDINLFFYYSGHGSYTVDLDGDEVDGYDETILPCDFKTGGEIVDDELKARLTTRLGSQCSLVGVLDCCHSGTSMDLPIQYIDQTQGNLQRLVTTINTKQPITNAKVIMLSGCKDDQTSAEALMAANWRAGALTTNLMNVLRSMGKRVPSWYEVWQKVKQRLASAGYSQNPQISSGYEMDLKATSCVLA